MKKEKCLIVAEISANHGKNFNRAARLVRTAKKCGADAVKFQAYTPDTLTIDADNKYFRIRHSNWKGQTLYQLYNDAFMPWHWLKRLKKIAREEGLIFFSTAFDKTSVDYLEELNVPFHKVSSFELNDLPLIRYMARTKKPVILSTGMATLKEITEAITAAKTSGAKEVVLLKCVSDYPAAPEDMNLNTIPDLKKRFKCRVGISDHSLGIGVSVASVCLGASLIERHLTLSRKIRTPDSSFSTEPQEFKDMVTAIRTAEKSLGKIRYGLTKRENKNRIFRRSLFVISDIKKGEEFKQTNVRSIRPCYGLEPKFIDKIFGKKAARNIKKGTPLKFDLIDLKN